MDHGQNTGIEIISAPWEQGDDDCALCATSCQSACKTSCTVGNVPCDKDRYQETNHDGR